MEQASLRLMRSLQANGHHLSLISLRPLGDLAPLLRDACIPAIGLGYGHVPLLSWLIRLRRELKRLAPEALLLTGHSLPVLFGIAGYCRGRRILAIHFHHTGVKPAWFWALYYRLACCMVDTVTFPSDFVRNEAISFCPPLVHKSCTLRNPLEPASSISTSERRLAREAFGLPLGAPVIGNAGWLIGRKRFDVFLHVAAEILRYCPAARFVIAGDGPDRRALESLARNLGVADSLVWLGWTADTRAFYASLDLLLFNSDWDAMGLTPLEAVIHGVPVVASVLNGGLSELLRPGVDAILIDSHDSDFLAQSCLRLLADPSFSAAMVARGREHVLALCDPRDLAAQHQHILQGR